MSFGPTPKNNSRGGTPKSFGPSARNIRKRVIKAGWGNDDFENLDDLTLKEKYPNILNFYVEPPGCDIRLETMETLAMERLRFLRIIEKYSRYVHLALKMISTKLFSENFDHLPGQLNSILTDQICFLWLLLG